MKKALNITMGILALLLFAGLGFTLIRDIAGIGIIIQDGWKAWFASGWVKAGYLIGTVNLIAIVIIVVLSKLMGSDEKDDEKNSDKSVKGD